MVLRGKISRVFRKSLSDTLLSRKDWKAARLTDTWGRSIPGRGAGHAKALRKGRARPIPGVGRRPVHLECGKRKHRKIEDAVRQETGGQVL